MQFQTVTTHSRVSLLTVHMHADYSLVLRLSLVGTPLKVTLNKMTQYYICKFKGGLRYSFTQLTVVLIGGLL